MLRHNLLYNCTLHSGQLYCTRTLLNSTVLTSFLLYMCVYGVFRGGDVAILDGTNITRDRRKIISDRIASLKDKGYDILWIESSGVVGDGVSEEQFEELKNSPDFLDKVRCSLYSSPTLFLPALSHTLLSLYLRPSPSFSLSSPLPPYPSLSFLSSFAVLFNFLSCLHYVFHPLHHP